MSIVKEAPWKVILVWLLLSMCMTTLINLVLFPSPLFDPIARATAYLIDATLQSNLLSILAFGLIIFVCGKLRLMWAWIGANWRRACL